MDRSKIQAHDRKNRPQRVKSRHAALTAILLELRAAMPTEMRCVTGCIKCCGPIRMSAVEMSRLTATQQSRFRAAPARERKCIFAIEGVGCEIYNERPMICRLYGYVPGLICPEGCTTHILTRESEEAWWEAYLQILDVPNPEIFTLDCLHQMVNLVNADKSGLL